MKELCIKFAEWVGIKTFTGTRMYYEIGSSGIFRWKIYNEEREIQTHELYQKFCDEFKIEFTISQKILYWDNEFQPTNFVEFIAKKNLFYFRSSYEGNPLPTIWTNKKGNPQLTTLQLWEIFSPEEERERGITITSVRK
jgi:hypothetical protein